MSAAEEEVKEKRKAQEDWLAQGSRELWKSVSELHRPKAEANQLRGQEFVKLPQDEGMSNPLTRRDFFKYFTAASAAIGATACTRRPKDYLVPYVNKPESFVYGVPVWYATSSPEGLGLLVKTREGRPIKLEGNPDHSLNRGGLDALTQAEVLNLYNPDRLRGALDVKSGRSLSWDEADERIKAAIQAARPGGVKLLVDAKSSPSLDAAIDLFRSRAGCTTVRFQDLSYEAISRAHEILGRKGIPFPRFDKADVVLSVDADFLGRWLMPAAFTKDFSSRRKIHDDETNQNQLFVLESQYSVTGVAADYRYAIKPSLQLKALMAVGSRLSQKFSMDAGLASLLRSFNFESLVQELGIPAAEVDRIASALAGAAGRALIVAGHTGPQAVELQLLTGLLNHALMAYGNTLDFSQEIKIGGDSQMEFEALLSAANAGEIDVLIIQGVNPAFSRPTLDVQAALAKIPLVVCLSGELNETAKLSHIALSESHFLEAWGDSQPVAGHYSIQQPVIEPIFDSRSLIECILRWATGYEVAAREFVQNIWKEKIAPASARVDFESWWQGQLRAGIFKSAGNSSSFSPKLSAATPLVDSAMKAPSQAGVELVSFESVCMGDGRSANNAWLQELPEPISKVTWGSYLSISPALAKELKLEQNDEVEVIQGTTKARLSVFIQPGLRSDVVVTPLGYGRQSAGTLGTGVGINALLFSKVTAQRGLQISGAVVELKKLGTRKELATTQQHFDLHGRDHDILQQTTLKKFLADATAAKDPLLEKAKKFSIYSATDHVYPGHRWGMAIDLNKCTGCQACVVACYSENNIGIVGRDQVTMGRHLAWLRLDLYYQGEEENPAATFEPMLCQQCERAPCETVCPVLATVHSSDGLNDMVYNRCVGTRYCANNCPYKVRRFNYFFYSKALAGRQDVSEESPLSLMLNPDVTVRSRGVMEKCTFCVQRIRKGVDEVKAEMGSSYRNRIPDQHIQTACEQSCPADAITFGDLNDPNSRVSVLAEKAQAFKVLEVLNTNPSVSYLPRIRNRGEEV